MKRAKGFTAKLALAGMMWLLSCAHAYARTDDISSETFEGILSGMTATPAPDTAKSNPEADLFYAIADIMTIDRTLDYITNIYSASAPYPHRNTPRKTFSNIMLTGEMVFPVIGKVTSGFGYRASFGRMHKGIDLSLHIGDTVRVAMDGIVSRVSVDPKGYGLYVVVRHHGDMETRYAHLSKTIVVAGQTVAAGQPIALGGNSGNSTGPHLHFETRLSGEAFDPTFMLNFQGLGAETANTTSSYPGVNRRTPATHKKSAYVVKAGDTLSSIAANAGISTLTLCRLNMISSDSKLTPGTMLRLR